MTWKTTELIHSSFIIQVWIHTSRNMASSSASTSSDQPAVLELGNGYLIQQHRQPTIEFVEKCVQLAEAADAEFSDAHVSRAKEALQRDKTSGKLWTVRRSVAVYKAPDHDVAPSAPSLAGRKRSRGPMPTGDLVGFILTKPVKMDDANGVFIDHMLVHPRHRKKGLSTGMCTSLLQETLSEVRATENIPSTQIITTRAISTDWWKRLGFHEVTTRTPGVGPRLALEVGKKTQMPLSCLSALGLRHHSDDTS